jgi:hypothetical protein
MYSDEDTAFGWVAPFGDPGINDCSHLPRAFRSVPRPSSPLSAKASTRCPSFALHAPHPTAKITVKPGDPPILVWGAVGRTVPRLDPGPTYGPAILLSRRNANSAVEDTFGIPRAAHRAAHGFPPRSHNSLIHICPSTTRPRHPDLGPAGGNICLMPRNSTLRPTSAPLRWRRWWR